MLESSLQNINSLCFLVHKLHEKLKQHILLKLIVFLLVSNLKSFKKFICLESSFISLIWKEAKGATLTKHE